MANLNISLLFLFSISLNFHLSSTAMSSQSASIPLVSSFDSPAVHIVYTERPHNEEPEAYHIRTLVSVLGRSVLFFVFCIWSTLKLAMNFCLIFLFAVKKLLGRLLCIVIRMLLVDSLLA